MDLVCICCDKFTFGAKFLKPIYFAFFLVSIAIIWNNGNKIEASSKNVKSRNYKYKQLEQMRRVLLKSQEQCLEMRENKELWNRIPLVTTYNPHTTYIAEIAHRHWEFLKSRECLSRIFAEPPLIAYRRSKNLRNKLVSTSLKRKQRKRTLTAANHVAEQYVAGAE